MVKISLGGREYTIENRKWAGGDPLIRKLLQDLLPAPSGADPWPDHTAAKVAVKKLGAVIIETTDKPTFNPNVLY